MEIKLTEPQKRALQGLARSRCTINTATFKAKPYIVLERLGFAVIEHYGNWTARATITESGHTYLSVTV